MKGRVGEELLDQFDLVNLKIGIAQGAGMTVKEQGEFADVDRTTVYNRRESAGELIDLIAAIVESAVSVAIRTKVDKAQARMAEMLERAMENYEEALENPHDDKIRMQISREVVGHFLSKAPEKIEQKTEVSTTKQLEAGDSVSVPTDILKSLVAAATRTQQLLLPQQEEAITVEVIPDE